MAVQAVGGRVNESARNLAYINYALLFSSVFFAGVPAVIAAVIAYSQRDDASPQLASHHNFQIRIFWVAFSLALAAGLCFLGAMLNVASEVYQVTNLDSWSSREQVHVNLADVRLDRTLVALIVGTGLFSALGGLWLMFAPAIGFIRLASERGMGHSAGS